MKKDFTFDSRDGKTRIHAIEWEPDTEPVCIVQIVHGMAEYAARYSGLAGYLNGKGILVVGHDHLGHGDSIGPGHPYGYFCPQAAPDTLVEDVHSLRRRMQAQYPQLPYFLLGHSMGSFILRNYLCVHGEGLAGAVIMGTGMQPKRLLEVSLRLVGLLTALQGPKHRSSLINALSFGSFNRRIRRPSSRMAWLSTDGAQVAKYDADPRCGFTFTLNGFQTLFTLILRLHEKERLEKMRRDLPILFMSGREDPVGDYGRAVEQVYTSFRAMGMKQVSMKLYENDRHELVNESDREMVWSDIGQWVLGRL